MGSNLTAAQLSALGTSADISKMPRVFHLGNTGRKQSVSGPAARCSCHNGGLPPYLPQGFRQSSVHTIPKAREWDVEAWLSVKTFRGTAPDQASPPSSGSFGPRVLSNFRRLAAVSASQHPLSLIISRRPVRRPDHVSDHGLPAMLLSRGRQWRSAINVHSEYEEALRQISRDGTDNIGAAHRGVSQTESSVLPNQHSAPPSKRAAPWEEDGSTAARQVSPVPFTQGHSPPSQRPERERNVRLVELPHCSWWMSMPVDSKEVMDVEKDASERTFRRNSKLTRAGIFLLDATDGGHAAADQGRDATGTYRRAARPPAVDNPCQGHSPQASVLVLAGLSPVGPVAQHGYPQWTGT